MELFMEVRIETNKSEMVRQYTTGWTVINTDDYPELKGKTTDEINKMGMDLMTLLNLKTEEGMYLVETMKYEIDGKSSGKRYSWSKHIYDVTHYDDKWTVELDVMS